MPPKKDDRPRVWVAAPSSNEEPYLQCRMVSDSGEDSRTCTVQPEGGGPELTLPTSDVLPCNPPGHRPDNTQLLYLNEPCVLANIVARYDEQQIYTWTSRILVAVNPYEEVDVYTEKHALSLPSLAPRELPPHAFSIAELAYRGLLHRRESQAVVVSGESGSGKTVSMSHVIHYLTRRTGGGSSSIGNIGGTALSNGLSELVLQSNPMLEAFGNAATVRNHNSSRFGKFVRLLFDTGGYRMAGLRMQTYLLEKVRVTRPAPAELTYHVFYYLLSGSPAQQREEWGLKSPTAHVLSAPMAMPSGQTAVPLSAEHCAASFDRLTSAMKTVGIRPESQVAVFELLAGILHLYAAHIHSGELSTPPSTSRVTHPAQRASPAAHAPAPHSFPSVRNNTTGATSTLSRTPPRATTRARRPTPARPRSRRCPSTCPPPAPTGASGRPFSNRCL